MGVAAGRRSLLFTGHIDVVPTVGEGQYGWWDGTVADGKLYGRGANDMKGGIAAYLMAARCIRDLGLELKGDLILETVVDEEFGGAHGSLACRLRGYNADLAILPEPNNMLVSTAHRGGQQFRLFAYTEGAGMDFGATVFRDPVTALGHLLAALDRYNEERQPRLRVQRLRERRLPADAVRAAGRRAAAVGHRRGDPRDRLGRVLDRNPAGRDRGAAQGRAV